MSEIVVWELSHETIIFYNGQFVNNNFFSGQDLLPILRATNPRATIYYLDRPFPNPGSQTIQEYCDTQYQSDRNWLSKYL